MISAPPELVSRPSRRSEHLSRWWDRGVQHDDARLRASGSAESRSSPCNTGRHGLLRWIIWTKVHRRADRHVARAVPRPERVRDFGDHSSRPMARRHGRDAPSFPARNFVDKAIQIPTRSRWPADAHQLAAYVTETISRPSRSNEEETADGRHRLLRCLPMSLEQIHRSRVARGADGPAWMELQRFRSSRRGSSGRSEARRRRRASYDNDIARARTSAPGPACSASACTTPAKRYAAGGAVPHAGFRGDTRERRSVERAGRDHVPLRRRARIEAALDRAREAAGERDVRIGGGGETILEYVNAGLVEEFTISLSPVLFGAGIALRRRRRGSDRPYAVRARSSESGYPPDVRRCGRRYARDIGGRAGSTRSGSTMSFGTRPGMIGR